MQIDDIGQRVAGLADDYNEICSTVAKEKQHYLKAKHHYKNTQQALVIA